MTTTTLIHNPSTNGGPPLVDPAEVVMSEIDDLYGEAKNWADGQPIADQATADAITTLYNGLHDAGKRCDEFRVTAKKPLDDAIDEIQRLYNPYVQPKKGKVAMGKDALGALLSTWRARVAAEAAEAAAAKRREAEKLAAEAQAAIRASAGNLEAREEAEARLVDAKEADKWAGRAEKAAATGTGLRSVWVAEMTDSAAALDWAYGRDAAAFLALAQEMAGSAVVSGARSIPGFTVREDKRATVR